MFQLIDLSPFLANYECSGFPQQAEDQFTWECGGDALIENENLIIAGETRGQRKSLEHKHSLVNAPSLDKVYLYCGGNIFVMDSAS